MNSGNKEIKKQKCEKCKKHRAKAIVGGKYVCKYCVGSVRKKFRGEFGGKIRRMRFIKNKQEIKRRIRELGIEQKKKYNPYRQKNIESLKRMLRGMFK